MDIIVRRTFTVIEEKYIEAGQSADIPLRKVAAAAVVENPFAVDYVANLQPMIDASVPLGERLAKLAVTAMEPYEAQSYGKGGIVGINGEQEHAGALLTTVFATPLREAIGDATAWISSMTKVAAAGATLDIPVNSKRDIYVRSHYDGMTLKFSDAPRPDEIVIIICLANRSRINSRVGGLTYEQAITKQSAM